MLKPRCIPSKGQYKMKKQLTAFAVLVGLGATISFFSHAEEGRIANAEIGARADVPVEQALPGGAASGQREVSYWPNGRVKEDMRYDDNGVMRRQGFFREDGTIEKLKKFDALGNVTDDINYSESGRLMENADGWAAMTFEYKNGNMISESYYGADGHLTERKLYDDQGVLLTKQYVGDGNIDPYEEYDPVPVLNKQEDNMYFDSEGRPEATTSVIRE